MPDFEPVLLCRISKPNSASLETYRADGGYCAAPCVLLNDTPQANVTPDKVDALVAELRQ